MAEKTYDVVLFGATSFVGQIICQYMAATYGINGNLKWAVASRSQNKLESVKRALGTNAGKLPLIIADASNEQSLKALCDQAKVVLSTVGPYALYGEPMVKACVETGTDYCDLTGEAQWIRDMLVKYEAKAKVTGARIVHCCGFDSIPSDMGVYFLQQAARKQYGQACQRVKLRVKAIKGGLSGGTAASMVNIMKEATGDAQLRKDLANPYLLCTAGKAATVRQPNVNAARFDKDFSAWLAPFVMAGINTRVVHRSNDLSGAAYGERFRYDEAVITGRGAKGWAKAQSMAVGMAGFFVAGALPPTRWLLENVVLPAPGEGPSPESQQNGFYDIRLYGETANGQVINAKVTGDRDPGYGSTAKMISEAAVCLAQEIPSTEKAGGFWTPATVFGDKLIKRLEQSAGLAFELI
ncbi:MAG: saccharopine dehydrogenase [Gammaproteobacteria bacterium]|nr:MAG: saccharopine dehydrogenase [Gammaproteobacteria bacterium]